MVFYECDFLSLRRQHLAPLHHPNRHRRINIGYTAVGGAAVSYNNNSNLTNDNGAIYQYDDENRLRSTSGTGIATSTLKYDPLGRLYEISINGAVTQFQYDGDALVAEYNSAGALTRRYVHGDQVDEPLM